GLDVVDADRGLGDGFGEGDEVLVLGDEVGLGVDLDDSRAVARLRERDAALGGDAVGLLVGLGQAGLAQRLGGGVDVAAGLGERLLALHHAGAGALAQFLDQGSGDFHWGPRDLWVFQSARPRMVARPRIGAATPAALFGGRGLVLRRLGLGLLARGAARLGAVGGFGELFLAHGRGARRGGLALEHGVGGGAGVQLHGADGVVGARD